MLAVSLGFLIAFALIFLQVPIATALGLVGFGGVVVLNGWTRGPFDFSAESDGSCLPAERGLARGLLQGRA
ncbi:hypothetical protein [Hydrogenophaga sp.]|uniref:hypothetical protein n=1 Tax=Hydrogenophaga sp. TaxID=1904254 RepID=UPI001AC20F8A|nr:hypothetical protein [Hydrogenophaga sp.]MBN9373765.1 hypothetical protein [Hydrogenophaga sp.]